VDASRRSRLRDHLALVSPGTVLRDGLDRIVHGRTGALIVLGHTATVQPLVTGGFAVDVPLTATSLRELAKLDGAILLRDGLDRIVHAGAHLMPEASIPTEETGTRHRTADMVSRQLGVGVVTVSASMSSIALFLDGERTRIRQPEHLLARANQGLATLSRYRDRLTEAANRLTALELQDTVTVGDVSVVLRRLELVLRLAAELDDEVVELGTEGRMVELQVQELLAGVDGTATALARDYGTGASRLRLDSLGELAAEELLDAVVVARRVGLVPGSLDARLPVRGYRQLAQLPRLSATVAEEVVRHFGSLQALLGASLADLLGVPAVDPAAARVIRDGLGRLAESYDRFDLPG